MIRIDFEGCDGSGKTTALKYAVQYLRELGYNVLDTREVGNPHVPVCVKLRELVLDPKSNLDGKSMELLFSAMRLENERFYASVQDQYDFVISDRGWFSHLAYTDNNVDPKFTEALYIDVIGKATPPPTAVVYLKVDPEVALKRRHDRNGFVDVIEQKGQGFQINVAASFNKWIDLYKYAVNTHVLDANESVESVQGQVRQALQGYLLDNAPKVIAAC